MSGAIGYRELIRKNRSFRLLWLGTLVSLFGDWFNTITLYALVTKLTGSPLAVGLVEFLKLGGFAAASIPGGILADRLDRRRLMIACDLMRAAIVPCYLLITSASDVPLLYVLIVLQIGLGAVFDPAYRAILPNLVSADELLTANTILAATWSTILAVGASLGGLMTVALGSDAVFLVNSVTYLGSAACLLALRERPLAPATYALEPDAVRPSPTTTSPRGHATMTLRRLRPTRLLAIAYADLRDGLRYLRQHRDVFRLALAKTAWALGGSALVYFLTQLGPKLAPDDVALGIGILYSARGLGTGIGPLLARRYIPRSAWLAVTGLMVAASGLIYATLGLVPLSFAIVVPIIIAHSASGANWVLSTVLLQERVPDHMRGRVFSAELMVLTGVEAVVILGAAALLEANVMTLATGILAFAALQFASGLGYTRWLVRGAKTNGVGADPVSTSAVD